jgi:hypothetical protein
LTWISVTLAPAEVKDLAGYFRRTGNKANELFGMFGLDEEELIVPRRRNRTPPKAAVATLPRNSVLVPRT